MEIKNILIEELKPNEKNPRKIKSSDLENLKNSIKEFGFQEPVIANSHENRENIVVGGHQRLKAAEALKGKLGARISGLETDMLTMDEEKRPPIKQLIDGLKLINEGRIPVTYVNLTKNKEETFNIALNKISGEWDEEKLAEMLKELLEEDSDISSTGFQEPEVDKLIVHYEREKKKQEALENAPFVPATPKSKLGEVWKLGDHTLMCGSSTEPEDFKKLMGKVKADMCWTDPPYGVSYKGSNNPNGKNWGVMKNDEMRGNDLYIFLKAVYQNIWNHTKERAAMYSCYASINHIIFEQTMNEAGWQVKQQLIWEKGHVLGHSDYHWSHEPILYCRKGDKNTVWYGDRTQKTVLLQATIENLQDLKKEELISIISEIREQSDLIKESKDPTTQYVHATQKPVNLSRRMIKNSSKPKDVVLEPFCGSGATLMACETTSRVCMAMELDPKYVDVILTRWAQFTEKDPVRSDGVKWSELQ